MGAAFYAVLDLDARNVDPLALDGKALSAAQEQLDAIASGLGVTPLMDFVSFSGEEQAAMAEDLAVPAAELNIRQEEWFDPSEGISTLQALLRYLTRAGHTFADDQRVIQELSHLLGILEGAKAAGARFHMSVSI